jgi:cytochrome P450
MESVHDAVSVRPDGKSVPVIRGFPGLGVLRQLRRNALEFFSETVKRYGDRVELRVLGRRILLITHPADVNDVLNAADFGRSSEVKKLRRVFGNGIYSSEGERWRMQRRALQPAFRLNLVMTSASMIVEHMTECVAKWRPGETLDVLQEMIGFTSDVICELIFGKEQSSDAKDIAKSVSVILETLRTEILYLELWQKLPLPRSRRWNQTIKSFHAAVSNMIAERRAGSPDGEDLLSILLKAKDENDWGMPDEYVYDEVVTMFVAGQETSAVALSWAMALCALHTEVQEEAAIEIAEVTNGREVRAEDYSRLKFLNAIVHETLRLYPPLWTIGRSAIRDTRLGELQVHAGTEVWIPIREIHRDARWFPQPERFNPHRWSHSIRQSMVSYIPFGGGMRSCIAQHFAMAELVLGLAVMLSRFRFRLEPGAKTDADAWLTLRPKNGVRVIVSPR